MKGRGNLEKFLVIGAIFLLLLTAAPLGLGGSSSPEEKNSANLADQYTNCIVLIYGKCNHVEGPLLWRFGLYAPLFKKSFNVAADGEATERLTVFIRSQNGLQGFGTYINYENIAVQINSANGVLFWGGKSILVNSTTIFCRCKADSVLVTAIS